MIKRVLIAAAVFAATLRADGACRSAGLGFTTRDTSLELGEYGTLFREASQPECRTAVHDQLLRKLRLALADGPQPDIALRRPVRSFERWLSGAFVGLAIPTAMQLGGAGLLDAPLDQAVRGVIAAYRFNLDPTCGMNFANECIDDLTQAAVAYAWSAAYEHQSGRANVFAAKARDVMHQALSLDHHLCIAIGDTALPRNCRSLVDIDNGIASGYYQIISFNHGFQDVAYGVGLMTSLSSAAIALDEAGSPFEATDEEVRVAWALFREGQQATLPDGSGFRSNCKRVVAGVLRSDSPCADLDYHPRMFPVRTFYERVFHNVPNNDPYQFDQFDGTLFQTAFLNDGRRAVYGDLGNSWWELRPRLDGYRGPFMRTRAVRH